MPKEVMVALSLAIEFFIGTEKAATKGCFKIIWRLIQHTPLKFFVEGCCSFTSVWFVLSAELLFECLKFSNALCDRNVEVVLHTTIILIEKNVCQESISFHLNESDLADLARRVTGSI